MVVTFLCVPKSSKIFHPRKNRGIEAPRVASRIELRDCNRRLDLDYLEDKMEREASLENFSIAQDALLDKILRALKFVPNFDGSACNLTRFLNLCDTLVVTYAKPNPGNDVTNLALINGIINKITGAAARALSTNGAPQNWNGIRSTLINSFSDHRDESTLYTDLSQLTQGSDSPHIFYERIQNLLSTIITYIEVHDKLETTIQAKRTLYNSLALKTYLKGLEEPLGSRIRCMRPETLEVALQYAKDEMNIIYLQNKNTKRQNFTPQISSSPTLKPYRYDINPQYQKPFNLPRLNNGHHFNNNSYKPNMYQQQGPSRTQQMFKALPRSNMSTGFRIPPRQPIPMKNYPQPMSGISHPAARVLPPTQTGHDWRIHGNPPPNNYFKTRQINNNELNDPSFYSDYDYDYDEYPCDFQQYDPNYLPYDCSTSDQYNITEFTEQPETINSENNVPEPSKQDFPKDRKIVFPE